ncbi:MAG: 3-deoxy-7-phosphoheptulonate synthase [Eubacteriaceae bacterium]|nr:3-deoxy-7-phosphoheptulonate synthase [Eubacteriaceae bacterium]
MNMEFTRKLPIPMDIKEKIPLTANMTGTFWQRRKEIADIFEGKDDRFILIIGPCSADSHEPVLEYLSRLAVISEKVKDKIFIIPRIYTNKPRTTGEGYKGMLHQPNPEDRPDMLQGIISIRQLHFSALSDYGFTCADELLYPENHRYISDILAYVAVGARSVENQQHRLVASGLDIPVGMKNPTGGDKSVMFNAITAAQHPHTFLYRGWEVHSTGNKYSHAILRGYTDFAGKYVSNYHYEDLLEVNDMYAKRELLNPSVIVDCNHANSGKKYYEQPRIAKDVLHSIRKNPDIRKLVKGLMIESYLVEGCQKVGGGVFGQSITDACLGWEDTEKLILDIAEEL